MEQTKSQLGFNLHLPTDYDTALQQVIAALKAEGFGVLTEIDVRQTFKNKLDVEFRPYKILGACNPPLAHRALLAAPEAGLLLPCNVIVSQEGENDILVSIVDPLVMLGVVYHPELQKVAEEARQKLERVANSLRST